MNINEGCIKTFNNSIVNYNKENYYNENDTHNKQHDMFIEESQQYKLTLRKKTLFEDLMKRRLKHNSNNNSSGNSIEQIGSIINEGMSLKKNDLIDKGICLLLKYIENNENTFHSKQKK